MCRRRSWRGNPGEHLTTCSCLPCQFPAGHCARWALRTWPLPPGAAHLGPCSSRHRTSAGMGTRVARSHGRTGICASGPVGFFWFRASTLWGTWRRPSSYLGGPPSNEKCSNMWKKTSFSANWTSEELNFLWRCPDLTHLLGKHCLLRWGTGEPGELPSMGLHRVGHDWSDLAAAAALGCYLGQRDVSGKVSYLLPSHCFSVPFLKTSSMRLTL